MTKNTPVVSATAIATWSTLLKSRGMGSFLPATTKIVVSTMVFPSFWSVAQNLAQHRTKFHLLAAPRNGATQRVDLGLGFPQPVRPIAPSETRRSIRVTSTAPGSPIALG